MLGKKQLFIISIVLSVPNFTLAQTNYWIIFTDVQADSLKRAFATASNDTVVMSVASNLGKYYEEKNRDSALYYFNKQLAIAQQLKAQWYEADAYSFIGYLAGVVGDYPVALESLIKSEDIVESGSINMESWDFPLFATLRGSSISAGQLRAANELRFGFLYGLIGEHRKRLTHLFECDRIAKEIDDEVMLSHSNINIGWAYLALGQLDSALQFEKNALYYINKTGYKTYEGVTLYLIGNIYELKGDLDEAQKYYHQSVEANRSQRTFAYMGDAYLAIAKLVLSRGQPDSSLYYSNRALSAYQTANAPQGLLSTFQSFATSYRAIGQIDSAYYYQNLYVAIKDSLYNAEKIRMFEGINFDEKLKNEQLEKERIQTEARYTTYTLLSGIVVSLIIAFLLYRNILIRKRSHNLLKAQNEQIAKQRTEVEEALENLKATQSQLIHSEKMASLGELTAGIAHEIQNPLNFVNNFSEVNKELIAELKEEIEKGDVNEAKSIAEDLEQNEEKIRHHGQRAEGIVKGMLQHSRTSQGEKEPTDINALADEYLRLAYHGMRAKDKSFNAEFKTDFDPNLPKVNVVPQDIGRVLLNLINNAFFAVNQNSQRYSERSEESRDYKPEVIVSTKLSPLGGGLRGVRIIVSDNGPGIQEQIREKIFQPFFTTKPTGQGTGLGLSLSYDIIKAHGGEIKVEGKEVNGTEFTVHLPIV
jgi:signal transduction histidine kinase